MSIVEKAEGRTLSVTIHIKMIPPEVSSVGEGDALAVVARDLIKKIEEMIAESYCEEDLRIQVHPTFVIY